MNTNIIKQKHFKPINFNLQHVDLCFYLNPIKTHVINTMLFTNVIGDILLNGIGIELISISLNGKTLKPIEYIHDNYKIIIPKAPKKSTIKIISNINPSVNSRLEGLYISDKIFVTQCEAQGFRRITYFPDRPDVLSTYTVKITGNKNQYPVILSNGNLVSTKCIKNDLEVVWNDPFKKPSYLFALVAGKLSQTNRKFVTKSKNKVDLNIWIRKEDKNKINFALDCLVQAMKWDEKKYNLEYDLNIFNIAAINNFNMGAMENKSLNIFNSKYLISDKNTSTDNEYDFIETIVAHEYFHNWTGNRITCRDWFQLSLKEGLTVFRDQEFSSDLRSRAIQRITDVNELKTRQFAEDSGPMAHPVRPESYIAMDNFYTATVYEKGAEVIRMIHTILGEEGFQKGMALYFERHDGAAVTIDDFVASMADANHFNFDSFMPWYSKSGTPEVNVDDEYDSELNIYRATFTQKNQTTPFLIPNKFGLLTDDGNEIESGMILIDELVKTFTFENIQSRPTPSWFRGFSAPIKFHSNLSVSEKIFLSSNDSDPFNRWDSVQSLWLDFILNPQKVEEKELFSMIKNLFNKDLDFALLSEMISLPSEQIIHQNVGQIDAEEVNHKRKKSSLSVGNNLKALFLETYQKLNYEKAFDLSSQSVGERALKNKCLSYLSKLGEHDMAYKQYNNADCMTDQFSAFQCLIDSSSPYRDEVISRFYEQHNSDVQVMDRWFSAQSISPNTSVADVRKLMKHDLFSMTNPNRIRSVIGSFSRNSLQFHCKQGYQLLTEVIIELDSLNPQIAARFVGIFNHWRRFTDKYSTLQKNELNSIINRKDLSDDVYEIVHSALKGKG